MTPTIEPIGMSAQAGPDSRWIQRTSGGRRGAATTAACTTSIAASEGMKPSAMPYQGTQRAPREAKRFRRADSGGQALFQRVDLGVQLGRELLAELGVVLADLRQLGRPALHVDLQELGHRLRGDVQAGEVDPALAQRREEADRRLLR